MKKIIALVLVAIMALFSLISCATPEPTPDNYQLKIGYLNGPTGMGMAKLINDNGGTDGNEKYIFEASTAELVGAAVTSGKYDIACVPTNLAAQLYNTSENIVVLALNCLNSLYVITDNDTTIESFEDLEGKTIYTCKGGTPAPILRTLLAAYDIEANVVTEYNGNVIAKPENLPSVITGGGASIVVAPEPIITSSLLQLKSNPDTNLEYSIDLDLGEIWDEKFDTSIAMGCIVANKSVVENHKSVVDAFLGEYEQSIAYIGNPDNLDNSAQLIKDTGIMAAVPAAKTALSNLNRGGYIAYVDGIEMKNTLINVFGAFGMNIIGGKLPEDEFYYSAN